MDPVLLGLRVVHVGAAMLWFGGGIVGAFFLAPTADALGKSGQPFMDHLMNRRRMGVFFPIVAALTILAGIGLYWRDSNGLDPTWITSPPGLAFTLGGLAAILSFVLGAILVGPAVAGQTAVRNELAAGDGIPNDEQGRRLADADRRMRLARRFDVPLLLFAAVTMAVGRYL